MVGVEPHSQLTPGLNKQQSRPNYNRRAHITHTRDIPREPSSEDQEDYTTRSHKTLQKATPPRLGVVAVLSNTQKRTERNSKNGETNMPQMKEQEDSSEKELNKMKVKQFIRNRLQSNGFKNPPTA